MPTKLENAFIKEYGKAKGKLIFYKWRSKHRAEVKHLIKHGVIHQ